MGAGLGRHTPRRAQRGQQPHKLSILLPFHREKITQPVSGRDEHPFISFPSACFIIALAASWAGYLGVGDAGQARTVCFLHTPTLGKEMVGPPTEREWGEGITGQ